MLVLVADFQCALGLECTVSIRFLHPCCKIEQASNQTLAAMLDNSETEASRVSGELQEMRMYLEAEGDQESSLFLKTLQVLRPYELMSTADCPAQAALLFESRH